MNTPDTRSPSGPYLYGIMGPLRFSRSPGVGNGIFIILAGVALMVWGINFLYKPGFVSAGPGYSYWWYDLPLGLVILGAGATVVWAGWMVLHVKTEIYRDGLVHQTAKGEVRILFRELKSFAYGTTAYRGGVYLNVHVMSFVDEAGRAVGFQVQPNWGWDKELPVLRDELSDLLAQKLEAQLDSGVAWIPGVEIRRDGLAFPGSGQPMMRFSAGLPLSFEQGRCSLKAGAQTYTGDMSMPNFYPGLRLIERGVARSA